MPVFHLSLHRLVFATNSTLQISFFEKYYKAHIGTKLAYKPGVTLTVVGIHRNYNHPIDNLLLVLTLSLRYKQGEPK